MDEEVETTPNSSVVVQTMLLSPRSLMMSITVPSSSSDSGKRLLDGAYTLDFHGIADIKIKPKVADIAFSLKLTRRRGFARYNAFVS